MSNKISFADVVISSRVRLARNFENIPFPAKLVGENAFKIQEQVFSAVKNLGEFSFYQISSLNENTKGVLMEKHLISANLTKNKYSAVILNKNESVSIMLNEEDHIREQCFIKGFNLKLAYSTLSKIDDAIIAHCNLAYSDELGFLTACPTNLGTGLRASCMLFLPALSIDGKMEQVLSIVKNRKQTIRGFYGEGSQAFGYLYQISNQTTLGKSEFEIIEEVESTIYEICAMEVDERLKFFSENVQKLGIEAKQCISQFLSGNSISINEFMQKVAIIKLYFLSKDNLRDKCKILDELLAIVQPCCLREISNMQIGELDVNKFRGQYLKKILKNVIQI